jgi:uncharacterized coiled-coil DUF342 family protein
MARPKPVTASDLEAQKEIAALKGERRHLQSQVAYWKAIYQDVNTQNQTLVREREGLKKVHADTLAKLRECMNQLRFEMDKAGNQRDVIEMFFKIMSECGCGQEKCCARGVGTQILGAMERGVV